MPRRSGLAGGNHGVWGKVRKLERRDGAIALGVILAMLLTLNDASAGPDADVARQCLRAAYMLYPYKRPGAAPMNGDRLYFFRQCVAKGGTGSMAPPKQD